MDFFFSHWSYSNFLKVIVVFMFKGKCSPFHQKEWLLSQDCSSFSHGENYQSLAKFKGHIWICVGQSCACEDTEDFVHSLHA